jgi:hypothetical protein
LMAELRSVISMATRWQRSQSFRCASTRSRLRVDSVPLA